MIITEIKQDLRKTAVVIPIYNEAAAIVDVIDEVRSTGLKNIIIVDDGSSDDTRMILSQLPVHYLKHSINRGKGAAVQTGITYAKLNGYEIIVTMDGDGQHDSKDCLQLITKIQNGYDVALGTRMSNPKGMPLTRKIANHMANLLVFFMFGIRVSDSQSGFRAYGKKAIDKFRVVYDKYEFDTVILQHLVKYGLSYTEVPINVRYTRYSMSKKNKQNFINGVKTTLNIIISQIFS